MQRMMEDVVHYFASRWRGLVCKLAVCILSFTELSELNLKKPNPNNILWLCTGCILYRRMTFVKMHMGSQWKAGMLLEHHVGTV